MTAIASALEYAYKGKVSLHCTSYVLLKLRHHFKFVNLAVHLNFPDVLQILFAPYRSDASRDNREVKKPERDTEDNDD